MLHLVGYFLWKNHCYLAGFLRIGTVDGKMVYFWPLTGVTSYRWLATLFLPCKGGQTMRVSSTSSFLGLCTFGWKKEFVLELLFFSEIAVLLVANWCLAASEEYAQLL